jgi:hypothetical protein
LNRSILAACVVTTLLLAGAVVVGYRALERGRAPEPPARAPEAPAEPTAGAAPATADAGGFLYGRVTTVGGDVHEGRLRFAASEEAFWSDSYYGVKVANPWIDHVPPERLVERVPIEVFGLRLAERERAIDVARPFVVPLGDLVRIDAEGRDVRATRKSGSVVLLDRYEAGDFDDGLRIWDAAGGAVDVETGDIRSIEFLPTPELAKAPVRLHGTVRSSQGELRGFVQWHGEARVASETLHGLAADGPREIPFADILAIARDGDDSSRVTRRDGRELVLSGTPDVGEGNLGVAVDDPRRGRVRVAWEAFERLDLDLEGARASGPAYGDFPPGVPLSGSVVTRDGRRLAGRLVFDLDESETTDLLDAPDRGLHHAIPFGLVAAIDLAGERVGVTLLGGEELRLERRDDLGDDNLGLLVFVAGGERAEHLPWRDVARLDLDPPFAIAPSAGLTP